MSTSGGKKLLLAGGKEGQRIPQGSFLPLFLHPQAATTKVPEIRDVTRIERIGE